MGISEILNVVLIFITGIYVYLTHKMAKTAQNTLTEMQEQTWNAMRPQIIVEPYVRPHTTILYLRIANQGKSVANNVRFLMDKAF